MELTSIISGLDGKRAIKIRTKLTVKGFETPWHGHTLCQDINQHYAELYFYLL